ncbi:hypothetical protein [Phycicoccus flavus]|uniref:hypothetical protein n=1 Tax=Phycicoccus flavus TaxID=2502783 RepID=UPI000FEBE234|nr:hypothetical protein [Phycicoccus flavus]NHA66519.1 hypothetical protein [Phycicoccus flavus]
MDRNRMWKLLGIASAAGVVATGVLVTRDERSRRAYSPDEVRDRLRERAARTSSERSGDDAPAP